MLRSASELLTIFSRFRDQILVVHHARLEHPADCNLPDAKTKAAAACLKLLALAVQRRGINAENRRRFVQGVRVGHNPPNMFCLDLLDSEFSA